MLQKARAEPKSSTVAGTQNFEEMNNNKTIINLPLYTFLCRGIKINWLDHRPNPVISIHEEKIFLKYNKKLD